MQERTFPFLKRQQNTNSLGILKHFQVESLLGEGGMGYVFEAIDLQLQRPVALKVIKPRLALKKENRQRFLREARSLASIRHENVVTIYDVGIENNFPFLAMELMEGETLASRLCDNNGQTCVNEVLLIARQICMGLSAAHRVNIVHRDIKPTNIWLQAPDSAVRILDFGLSRGDQSSLSRYGTLMGTPRYISPEQVRGEPVDGRCDLYAVGVILYEMLSGQRPHDESTVPKQLAAVAAIRAKPLKQLKPELPSELTNLVDALLEKQRENRPENADQVIQSLDEIVGPTLSLAHRFGLSQQTSVFTSRRKTLNWLGEPVPWMLGALLLPGMITFASLLGNSTPTILGQPAIQDSVAEIEKEYPVFTRRELDVKTASAGLVNDSIFSVRSDGLRPANEFVNVSFQPTQFREVAIFRFSLDELEKTDSCVDAMLTFTLKGGSTASGERTLEVYVDTNGLPNNEIETIANLRRLIQDAKLQLLGKWTFANPGFSNNGRVDAIRFSSSELIELIRNKPSNEISIFLWRVDASNAQTHIYSDPNQPKTLPKLWIQSVADEEIASAR